MRSLYLIAFACFFAVAIAQPATVLQLISGNAKFQVLYRANELPQWSLNDRVYYVLGSLPCAFGEQPIWNGTDWFCGDFPGFPSGTSLFERLQCQAGQNIAYNGTHYICSFDSDLLAALRCPNGQIPKKIGSAFVCAIDSDLLSSVTCNNGDILIHNGNVFACAPQSDRDTLRDLRCSEGQTVKYINNVWTCANDEDDIGKLICAAGQVPKWNGNSFICGNDADLLATLPCVTGQTLVGDSPNQFRCVPEPRPPGVPISFVDGQSIFPSTTITNVDTYFGSPYGRSFNPIQLANGFQAFAISFNFNVNPRLSDPDFTFAITIYKRSNKNPSGLFLSAVVQQVQFPAGATTSHVQTLDINYDQSEQLYAQYTYSGLNVEQGLSVTTVLFVRHYVF